MDNTGARITPGAFHELGPINWALSRVAARVMRVEDMHIFSTLGRTRGMFRGWMYYSSRLMPLGPLSRRDTEMVIIRTAHLRRCAYELDHHLPMGRRAGIDAATAEAIATGPDAVANARDRALLTAVDEIVIDRDISDSTWADVTQHFSERQLIGLLMLVGQYDSLATTIAALRIQRDR